MPPTRAAARRRRSRRHAADKVRVHQAGQCLERAFILLAIPRFSQRPPFAPENRRRSGRSARQALRCATSRHRRAPGFVEIAAPAVGRRQAYHPPVRHGQHRHHRAIEIVGHSCRLIDDQQADARIAANRFLATGQADDSAEVREPQFFVGEPRSEKPWACPASQITGVLCGPFSSSFARKRTPFPIPPAGRRAARGCQKLIRAQGTDAAPDQGSRPAVRPRRASEKARLGCRLSKLFFTWASTMPSGVAGSCSTSQVARQAPESRSNRRRDSGPARGRPC